MKPLSVQQFVLSMVIYYRPMQRTMCHRDAKLLKKRILAPKSLRPPQSSYHIHSELMSAYTGRASLYEKYTTLC